MLLALIEGGFLVGYKTIKNQTKHSGVRVHT